MSKVSRTLDGKPVRRFPAIARGNGLVSIFDPWIEGSRTWIGPVDDALAVVGEDPHSAKTSRANTDPLIGEALELVVVAEGVGVGDLDHIARAPLLQIGIFGKRYDIADGLMAAGAGLRVAAFEALVGGVVGEDGWMRANIGDAEIAVDPMTGAWSVENGDGHRRGHTNPWGLSFALGAVSNGVFAVRLLEAFFRRKMPPAVALTISDAVDEWGPTPKEVRP